MDAASLIYEELESKIPGIEVFVGYGSEFDKSKDDLNKKKTNRKAYRNKFRGLTAPIGAIREIMWKSKEDEYDCLILCDNVKEAFLSGLESFPDCYTPCIEKYISESEDGELTKNTNVIYMTYVYIESLKRYIKIGFCDYFDTLNSMITFDSQYIPFRLLKKNYVIKSTPMFDDALEVCRSSFDVVAGFLNPELTETLETHNRNLYGASYSNDVRNGIAEDPHKLDKLLKNHADFVFETYGMAHMYTRELHEYQNGERKWLLHKKIPNNWFNLFPEAYQKVVRKAGLLGCDLSRYKDRERLANYLAEYISERNKLESRTQPLRGLHSTGLVNTAAYGLRKINKANRG